MFDNVSVVVPVLDNNQYYSDGDLVRFGDTTLLEWKISQILGITNKENIYISTPSDKIIDLVQSYGVNFVKRSQGSDPSQWIKESVAPIESKFVLWTHATSPFISSGDYRRMLETFFNLPQNYDSLIAVCKEQEYIFYQNEPLNFDTDQFKGRKDIEPVFRNTNGCYITPRENYRQNRIYFGKTPFYYEVDNLTSLEIKDIDHYEMALNLLSLYFKTKEI
jgi:CMP-N-acetylneuraminic acid synthetase